MFPNIHHDHQVVWVDEVNREAFAIGQDYALRRSTWPITSASPDAALRFGSRISFPPSGKIWCSVGTFLRLQPSAGLPNGATFVDERDIGQGIVTNTVLKRSTNAVTGGFMTFSTVWTARAGVTLTGPQSICVDEVTGFLYLVEYIPDAGSPLTDVNIFRSEDDGATWSIWKTMPRGDDGTNNWRHIHSCRYDSVSQRVYFCVGDQNDLAGIWRVNAAGTDIEQVVTNVQLRAPLGQIAIARCVDVMFLPNFIAWPSDGSGDVCYINILPRTEIGAAEPTVTQIASMNSTGWWTQRASDDGSMWVCCGSNEDIPERLDKAVHVYSVIEDAGEVHVDEVGAFSMEIASASTSISGMAAGNGGGDYFWMRGHNLKRYPNTTYSGFQFRASLGWGAIPTAIPSAAPRDYGLATVGGAYSLAAGETKIIGHTQAPVIMRRLLVSDLGIITLSGTGTVELEIYNATTASLIVSYAPAAGASWRAAMGNDTSEGFLSRVTGISAGDVIHVRLRETGGAAAADVSAFATCIWQAV